MIPSAGRKKRLNLIRRLARVAITLVAGGMVLLAAGYQIGPEAFWLVALAQYVPYPLFLVPSFAALGLSLTLGWRWRLSAFLGFLLALTSITGLEFNQTRVGPDQIRVMTYNVKDYITIRRENGLSDIASEVSRHDPDIVVLQDARRVADDPQTLRSMFAGRQTFAFGQYVVASRFPLRDCARREIPFREEPHTYVSCVVTANGMDFGLITAHFLTPRAGLTATRHNPLAGISEWKQNIADRLSQAGRMAEDLRSLPRPTIVAGDLNAPDTSLVVRALLDEGLRDAFSVAGFGYGHTWGHSLRFRLSFLRIDHILVSPEFVVTSCFVGGALGSEHRPVIADLYLIR